MPRTGTRYEEAFPDFIAKYHDPSMYTAGFRKYSCPEEKWTYWSRAIVMDRYEFEDNGTYAALRDLLKDRDYFVLTTNVDHCFQRFGFDKTRLFYTLGDYGLWKCSGPCRPWTYDNEDAVRRMAAEQKSMRVPSELVPRCPVCGRPMTMNLRCDETFAERMRAGTGRPRGTPASPGRRCPAGPSTWSLASDTTPPRSSSSRSGACRRTTAAPTTSA